MLVVVETLLEYHVELDTLRESLDSEKVALSPLMLATLHASMQMLEIILADGRSNINLRDSTGKTTLLIAVRNRWIDVAKLLLAQKMVDVNVADDDRTSHHPPNQDRTCIVHE